MDQKGYQRVVDLINAHKSIVEFAPFGKGVSQEWIEKAEIAIGMPVPISYKWWLRNYGGGEIGGEEIFSVYGEDFNTVVGGDIVYMYRLALRDGQNPMLVPICQSDVDGTFSFEVETDRIGNEYAIYSQATGQRYAENFLDFLEKRISAF